MTIGASTRAVVDEVSTESWSTVLNTLGLNDIYYHVDFVRGSAELDHGRPVLLRCGGAAEPGLVMAGIVRPIQDSDGAFDFVTPYGYGGWAPTGAEELGSAHVALAFHEWCVANNIVTSFVRTHPLWANEALCAAMGDVTMLAPTVAIRLDEDRDLMAQMHPKHRNKLRKAQNAGLTVSAVERPADIAEFVAMYERTMQRLGAQRYYVFPEAYWRSMCGPGLREQLVRFDAAFNGRTVASALCFTSQPWLHYHLSATEDDARSMAAANIVVFAAAEWAQQRGYTRMHLGGGLGGSDDSLRSFKLRFDPGGECAAGVVKTIHDASEYERLTGKTSTDGYFPAYRAP